MWSLNMVMWVKHKTVTFCSTTGKKSFMSPCEPYEETCSSRMYGGLGPWGIAQISLLRVSVWICEKWLHEDNYVENITDWKKMFDHLYTYLPASVICRYHRGHHCISEPRSSSLCPHPSCILRTLEEQCWWDDTQILYTQETRMLANLIPQYFITVVWRKQHTHFQNFYYLYYSEAQSRPEENKGEVSYLFLLFTNFNLY